MAARRARSGQRVRRAHPAPASASRTSRVRWPAGSAATKNRVSNRRGLDLGGVIQCAHGRSRSARSSEAAPGQQLGQRELAVAAAPTRSVLPVGPVVSDDDRRPRTGPASSTPDSSNVSRTAAHTSARASPSSASNGVAQSAAGGPAQPTAASASRGSTAPPGKTFIPAAKAIPRVRRSR